MDTHKRNPVTSETLGGELATGWDSTDKLHSRVESFAILKQRTKLFTDWALEHIPQLREPNLKMSQGIVRLFRSIQDCGQYLIFRNFILSKRSRLIGACSCKQHLLCAFCASRRGVRNSSAYAEKISEVKKQNDLADNPELLMLFITFTVKNGENLWERFTHLKTAIRTLLKHRNNQASGHRKHTTEMFKLLGGVFAYEFKRGSGENLWHPHIHMVALIPLGTFLDVEVLKAEWEAITGDSSVINIQYVKEDSGMLLEVFAYALKFSEMSHADRWGAAQLLKGEKLISSFGVLRGVQVPDVVTDDILVTDEPYFDSLFQWHEGRYGAARSLESLRGQHEQVAA